jgi:hypothetical protein
MSDASMNAENTKPAKNLKADLEMMYIEKYLGEKGFSLKELARLPEEEATRLKIEASQYASFKLEELESRARLLTKL